MKIFLKLFLIFLIISSFGFNQNVNIYGKNEKKQIIPVPELKGWINDYTSTLNNFQKRKLSLISKKLENQVGSQVCILIINSINGESIEDFSLRVANTWKIGRKNYNDGILIVLAMKEKKIRIEVGLGLEKIIINEFAKQIIENEMVPRFKKNDFYNGLKNAEELICNKILENKDLIIKN